MIRVIVVCILKLLYLKLLGGVQSVEKLNEECYVYYKEEQENLGYVETIKALNNGTFESATELFKRCRVGENKTLFDYKNFKKGVQSAISRYNKDKKEKVKRNIENAIRSV